MIIRSSDEELPDRPKVVVISDSPVKSPEKKLPQSDLNKTRYGTTKHFVILQYCPLIWFGFYLEHYSLFVFSFFSFFVRDQL